jgi:hypothetical protein
MVFANDAMLSREIFPRRFSRNGVLLGATRASTRLSMLELCAEVLHGGRTRSSAVRSSPRCTSPQVRTGTFLYIRRGVEIALPVESFHWLAGE